MTAERDPRLLRQPADAPPPLTFLGDLSEFQGFRNEWRAQVARAEARLPLRARARRWAGRISGRSDRRLLFAIAQATDALAVRCDEMAERLSNQEGIVEDVATAYGEDLTHLRTEIRLLRELVAAFEQPRG